MPAEYDIGQKVAIKPAGGKSLSARDSDVLRYAGQTGEITDYHWIEPPAGGVFYLYTVRIDPGNKEIVLYADELEGLRSAGSRPRRLKTR